MCAKAAGKTKRFVRGEGASCIPVAIGRVAAWSMVEYSSSLERIDIMKTSPSMIPVILIPLLVILTVLGAFVLRRGLNEQSDSAVATAPPLRTAGVVAGPRVPISPDGIEAPLVATPAPTPTAPASPVMTADLATATALAHPQYGMQNLWPTGPHDIVGVVVDEGARPVVGAAVWVARRPRREDSQSLDAGAMAPIAITDEHGRFRIAGVAEGAWLALARADGLGDGMAEATVPQSTSLRIVLPAGAGTIAGRVVEEVDGSGVPGAELALRPVPDDKWGKGTARTLVALAGGRTNRTHTEEDGAFRFIEVAAGRYKVEGDLGEARIERRDNRPDPIVVEPRAAISGIVMQTHRGWSINGRVTDATTGQPIGGVIVDTSGADAKDVRHYPNSRHSTLTDANGDYALSYVFSNSSEGGQSYVRLQFVKEGYGVEPRRDTTTRDSGLLLPRHDRFLRHDTRMVQTIEVRGRVVDANRKPVDGGAVDVRHEFEVRTYQSFGGGFQAGQVHDFVRLDEKGEFRFPARPETTVYVAANLDGGFGSTGPIAILRNTRPQFQEIVLGPSCTIAGEVRQHDGQPPSAPITLALQYHMGARAGSNQRPVTTTDAGGRFRFEGVAPGQFEVQVDFSEALRDVASKRVSLKAGDSRTDLVITMPQAHFLAGQVLRADGSFVKYAELTSLYQVSGPNSSAKARTDEQGRFRIEPLYKQPRALYLILPEGRRQNWRHSDRPLVLDDASQVYVVDHLPSVDVVVSFIDGVTQRPIPLGDIDWPTTPEPVLEILSRDPGVVRLRRVRPDATFALEVDSPRYLPRTILVSSLRVPKTGPEGDLIDRTFSLYRPAVIEGRLINEADGAPLVGFDVHFEPGEGTQYLSGNEPSDEWFHTTSSSDGRFRVEVGPCSQWRILVRDPELLQVFALNFDSEVEIGKDLGELRVKLPTPGMGNAP